MHNSRNILNTVALIFEIIALIFEIIFLPYNQPRIIFVNLHVQRLTSILICLFFITCAGTNTCSLPSLFQVTSQARSISD